MTGPAAVDCESLHAQISAYLDGDLGAATCQAIEAHAATCTRCADVIADFRKATGLCRKAADAPLPADVRELARARVKALMKKGFG